MLDLPRHQYLTPYLSELRRRCPPSEPLVQAEYTEVSRLFAKAVKEDGLEDLKGEDGWK